MNADSSSPNAKAYARTTQKLTWERPWPRSFARRGQQTGRKAKASARSQWNHFVFPYRREGEDPTRMFAGEGTPERTNGRFHDLSVDAKGARLSTAFDSVTLYFEAPAPRPDIFGKIGISMVWKSNELQLKIGVVTVEGEATVYINIKYGSDSDFRRDDGVRSSVKIKI